MGIIVKLITPGHFVKTVYTIRIIKLRDISNQDYLNVNHVMIRLLKYIEFVFVYF
jgi:hypothetical protein